MKEKVIIIGAGIAGPILAVQLKEAGYDVEIYETRTDADSREGVFLGFTPNGLNVLRRFIDLEALKEDFTTGSMQFYNKKGVEIGRLMTDYQKVKYDCETIQVKRYFLNNLVSKAAEERSIIINYGKKCVKAEERVNEVKAFFEDGTSDSGSILIGCDGTFSAVRNSIFPRANRPVYTKNISTGGYAKLPELNEPLNAIQMTFGERGFFAYNISNNGEIWWFNNYYRQKEPAREEVNTVLKSEIKNELLRIHKNDNPLFSKIINATTEIIAYPVYDIPKLDQWHTRRICLAGDAAHTTSPHIGQGASLALEDTVCLVNCLKSKKYAFEAFAEFQTLRQPRVEKIVKGARKVGNTKSKHSAIAAWFRDKLLGSFISREIKKLDWVYGYIP